MDKLELRFTYEYQEELGEPAYSSRDIAVGTVYVRRRHWGRRYHRGSR